MIPLPLLDLVLPRAIRIELAGRFLQARARLRHEGAADPLQLVRAELDAVLRPQKRLEQVPPRLEGPPGLREDALAQVCLELLQRPDGGGAGLLQLRPRRPAAGDDLGLEAGQELQPALRLAQRRPGPFPRDLPRIAEVPPGLVEQPRSLPQAPRGGVRPLREGGELPLHQVVDAVLDLLEIRGWIAEREAQVEELALVALEGTGQHPRIERFVRAERRGLPQEPRQLHPVAGGRPPALFERLGAPVDETVIVLVDPDPRGHGGVVTPRGAQDFVRQRLESRIHSRRPRVGCRSQAIITVDALENAVE